VTIYISLWVETGRKDPYIFQSDDNYALGGLWDGASLKYIIWGDVLQGLVINKIWDQFLKDTGKEDGSEGY